MIVSMMKITQFLKVLTLSIVKFFNANFLALPPTSNKWEEMENDTCSAKKIH